MKSAWSDGTRAILFSPQELIEKLVAIIPQPRIHLIRFHGILAPSATDREKVVPHGCGDPTGCVSKAGESTHPRPRQCARLSWSELLRRTFAIDITQCRVCGSGTVQFEKAVADLSEIRLTLMAMGIPASPD